jgi:hypothetical protein
MTKRSFQCAKYISYDCFTANNARLVGANLVFALARRSNRQHRKNFIFAKIKKSTGENILN